MVIDPSAFHELQIIVGRNLARAYAECGNNKEALTVIDECIELALRCNYEYIIESLYVGKAYNMVNLASKGEGKDIDIGIAHEYLRQAYFLAAARCETGMMEQIKQIYNKYFKI